MTAIGENMADDPNHFVAESWCWEHVNGSKKKSKGVKCLLRSYNYMNLDILWVFSFESK